GGAVAACGRWGRVRGSSICSGPLEGRRSGPSSRKRRPERRRELHQRGTASIRGVGEFVNFVHTPWALSVGQRPIQQVAPWRTVTGSLEEAENPPASPAPHHHA